MTSATKITNKDFDKIRLKYQGLVILECAGDHNGLLKTMESVIDKLQESITIPFRHLRIDPQKDAFIIHQFHVFKEPSYLFFFNGKFIDRLDGIISYNDFSRRINEHITSLTIDNNDSSLI
ncbi:MAG: hypothetical protein EA361_10580 [Bacteroidetes bacterium]|nr:MAG: hypothetical protein EA361_10580 [Bacteroidota bacterium]